MKLVGTATFTVARVDHQARVERLADSEYINSDMRRVTDDLLEAAASHGGHLRALSVHVE